MIYKTAIVFTFSLLVTFPAYTHAEFLLGATTHIAYKGQSSELNMQSIKIAGLNSLRDEFKWGVVETEKNKYSTPTIQFDYFSKAAEANIMPLVILDYGNLLYENGGKPVSNESIGAFANYSKYTAKQLSGKVKHFEIWNEWFPEKEPTSAETYFKLMRTVAPIIRETNINATIITGGVTIFGGWVEKIVELGALKYVDGIGIHPYVHCEGDNRAEVLYNYVKDISSRLNKINEGKPVPLYITETGWPSHEGKCSNTPEVVAQYLARGLLLIRTITEVKGFWWYDLKNDGNNAKEMEHNFGLLNYDYTPKPALAMLQDLAPIVINAKSVVRIPASKGIIFLELTDIHDNKSFALWNAIGKKTTVYANFTRKDGISPVLIRVGTHNTVPVDLDTSKSKLVIPINGTPIIISGIKNMDIYNSLE